MTIGYNRLNPAVATPREVASAVNLLIDGKSNNRGTFTLAANATTTTVTDLRAGSESVILFTPMTATAAAENMFVSARNKQSFVVTHANDSTTDRNFIYVVIR